MWEDEGWIEIDKVLFGEDNKKIEKVYREGKMEEDGMEERGLERR